MCVGPGVDLCRLPLRRGGRDVPCSSAELDKGYRGDDRREISNEATSIPRGGFFRRDYEAILAKLALDHADLELIDLEPPVGTERLREFIDHRWGEAAPRTRGKVISVLRDFFAYQVSEQRLSANPALPISRPRRRDSTRGTFSQSDVSKILTACSRQRDRVAVLLLFRLGLRKGELARLQFRHYDGRNLTVQGKGGKVRLIPVVDDDLRLELERHYSRSRTGPG